MEEHNNKYLINIFERYNDLKKSNKKEFDNNDLWKIFEYYSCIKLSEEYKKIFYEYDDIDPNFKEINKMSRNDTGIDASDLENTIVQCKLRKNTLNWKECSTFFGSQNIYSNELKKAIVRWENLIITRNDDCTLSENLLERYNFKLFIDRQYNKKELINFCEDLLINKPEYPIINNDFKLRDYQIEAINMINEKNKNVIINLPTGSGKNMIIIYSFKDNKKYLVLVPRIILMEQLKDEIIKHKPNMKNKIQFLGNSNNTFNENKLITICVFNSIHLIENYYSIFEKIYIDEAHHINKPSIYCDYNDEKEYDSESNINDDLESNIDEDYYNSDNDAYDLESISDGDDKEDELVNVKNYTKTIKSLTKYNNNIYLSATIDKIDDFEYYSKDLRTMIDLKYLCDYTIHVPVFNEDPTNKNICEYLLKNYKNMIIYCNSQKEGKIINELMNKLQLNSSEYIDCNTSIKKRNTIISKYKNGDLPFLVNVKILVEGFDASITKSVCFLHLPQSKTTLIQIIGRALRLHQLKNIANIILPFSTKEDEKNICNFLKIIASNDSRIKKSYENKKLGGYISIENTNEDNIEENEEIEFKYNIIYNSLGIIQNGNELWEMKKNLLFEFCNSYKRIPTQKESYKNANIGTWLQDQKRKINSKECDYYKKLIENNYVKISLDEYLEYKELNSDKIKLDYETWKNLLFEFCDINKRIPKKKESYKNNNIGIWLQYQKGKINNKDCEDYKKLVENNYVKETLDKYLEYKELNNDKIKFSYEESKNLLFEFCNIHKRIPKNKESYKNANIGFWLNTQKKKINNKICEDYKKLSINNYVKISLDEYLDKKELNIDKIKFSYEESKNLLFEFSNINKKIPSQKESYKNNNIGVWLQDQKKKINNKICEDYKKLSINNYIKISLDEYLEYKELNSNKIKLDYEELKNLLFEFCNINKRIPKKKESYKNNNIGSWLQYQKGKINNKECEDYKKLVENNYVKISLDEYLDKKK